MLTGPSMCQVSKMHYLTDFSQKPPEDSHLDSPFTDKVQKLSTFTEII